MDDHPEMGVLRAAESGDPGPLWELLESYRERLRRMIGLRIEPRLRGRIDASDVIQESFLEVSRRVPDYLVGDAAMPFYLWVRFLTGQKLLQLHRFHMGAAIRDARREVPIPDEGAPAASSIVLAGALVDAGLTPSQLVSRDEEVERLGACLEGMKEIDREILALRHFEQLRNQEVAQVLGLTEATASWRYLRALKRLKDEMIDPSSAGGSP